MVWLREPLGEHLPAPAVLGHVAEDGVKVLVRPGAVEAAEDEL